MGIATDRRARPARLALLVPAIGQLISPLFLWIGNASLQADSPGGPPIVPAGYTFAIWALICVLGAAYAGWQLIAGRSDGPDGRALDDLAWPLAGVFAGFNVWLVVSLTGPSWLNPVIFAAMLALLVRALQVALAARARIASWSRTGRALLWGLLGIYSGWSSVAVWVNLTTALADVGAPVTGTLGILGQLGVLAAATATVCLVTVWTGGLLPYAGAAAWALLGAAVGAAAEAPLLAGAAAAGLLALIGVTVVTRRPVAAGAGGER